MSNKELELVPYRWYAVNAPGATGATIAQFIAARDSLAIMRYKNYSSFFFRSTHQLTKRNIYGRAKDPRWLHRLVMCFASLFLDLKFNDVQL